MQVQTHGTQRCKHRLSHVTFAQKDGSRESERGADRQCEDGRVQCSPDLGEDAVALGIRIPNPARKEPETILPNCGYCGKGDSQHDKSDEHDGEAGKNKTRFAEDEVDQHLAARRHLADFAFSRAENRVRGHREAWRRRAGRHGIVTFLALVSGDVLYSRTGPGYYSGRKGNVTQGLSVFLAVSQSVLHKILHGLELVLVRILLVAD